MSAGEPGRILFVTSNGTGLGHLTRSMAIARRLGSGLEPLFLTLSAAAPVVRGLGFPVEYVASYDRPCAGNDWRWTRRVRARLREAVLETGADLVMFDGTHPYERLLPALRASGAPLVWCRRAMWRADSDTAPLWRSHMFDAALEPGEFAAEADRGPTAARRAEATVVDPIVLLDRSELLPREQAERELGLEPGQTNALVQLGQGEGVREAAARCVRHLAHRGGVQVAALSSTLGALGEVPEGVVYLEATYPMSRYVAAFDLAVSAAGYNAYHELIHLGAPTLFVPMPRQTDDQAARARYAQEAGVGIACAGPDDPALESLLDELLDPARRRELRERLDSLKLANGAEAAARWLEALAGGNAGPGGASGARRRGLPDGAPHVMWPQSGMADAAGHRTPLSLRLRRWWIFVSSMPRTVLRIGGQILRRPRMRAVVLALGLGEGELERRLPVVLEAIPYRPAQVLVITDELDFAPLLAAGVGFEHVPAPGERQAELAGVPYEQFVRRRLALILAGRPRPRRLLALGALPEAVAESLPGSIESAPGRSVA